MKKVFLCILCSILLFSLVYGVITLAKNWSLFFSSSVENPVEPPDEKPPDIEEPPVTYSPISDFIFENEKIVEYIGKDENVYIPKSYSLGEKIQEEKVFNSYSDLSSYLNANDVTLNVVDSVNNSFSLNKSNLFINMMKIRFPVNTMIEVQTFVEGNDFKITTIGDNAFADNENLLSIVIPDTMKIIGSYAFSNCINLLDVKIPNSVVQFDYAVFFNCKKLESIIIPNSVNKFGDLTFKYCEKLTNVQLPDNLDTIHNQMFSGCSSLSTIDLPETIKYIEKGAFGGTAFETFKYPNLSEIPANCFSTCKNSKSIELPENRKTIGSLAFSGCSSLQEINLPDSLNFICDRAFEGCEKLEFINFPKELEIIEEYAFKDCINLSDFSLSFNIKYLSSKAFDNCPNLPITESNNGRYLGSKQNPYLILLNIIDYEVSDFKVEEGCVTATINGFYTPNSKSINLSISSTLQCYDDSSLNSFKNYNVYENGRYLGNEENPYVILVGLTDTSMNELKIHPDCKIIDLSASSSVSGSFPNITEIMIPASVQFIAKESLTILDNLNKIEFEENSKFSYFCPLFAYGLNLKEIYLPSSYVHVVGGLFSSFEGIKIYVDNLEENLYFHQEFSDNCEVTYLG